MKQITKQTILHLSLIPHVGPATIKSILSIQSIKNNIYNFSSREISQRFSLSEKISKIIHNGLKDKKLLEQELKLIEKYRIRLVTILDNEYPESLKDIYTPPPVLYCAGAKLEKDSKRIAIVGSRKADRYAEKTIFDIVPTLVQNNYEIVSGGATGADTMAHKATLENKGKTIVVFGAGLMHPYPKENKDLFRKIAQNNGTLISSFPLDTPPARGNFPARNRIVSGLSDGCLVVQAAKKSGALITAQFALDQGKQVFALPGKIYNELSAGCHKLIQDGAKLVTGEQDIFEELEGLGELVTREVREIREVKKIKIETDPILKLLDEPCSIDELSQKSSISLPELQDKLFMMQLEGKIKQNFAGLWEKP